MLQVEQLNSKGGMMKKILLAVLIVLGLASFCYAQDVSTNIAEFGLDNIEGVAIYIPGDKSMSLGVRMELARSGIPGVTNYKILTMGLVAGGTFLNEKDTTGIHVLFGPDIGLSVPHIVEWAGGEWPNKNITASLTAGLPYDLNDNKFKAAIVGALLRVQW
jgi:hypothetical protein